MGRKGQFKKGGGRYGDGKARKSTAVAKRKSRGGGGAKVITVTKYRNKAVKKVHHRRKRGHGGMPNILHLGLATAALSYLTGPSGPEAIKTYGNKIPGAATFGLPAVGGLACLAVDRFVKPNKYLKLAGIAGIVLAATKIGEQGSNFKFVGDEEMGDIGDDDIGDIGDDDVGDYED